MNKRFTGTLEITDPDVWSVGLNLNTKNNEGTPEFFLISIQTKVTNLEDEQPGIRLLSQNGETFFERLNINNVDAFAVPVKLLPGDSVSLLLFGQSSADIGTTVDYTIIVQEVR